MTTTVNRVGTGENPVAPSSPEAGSPEHVDKSAAIALAELRVRVGGLVKSLPAEVGESLTKSIDPSRFGERLRYVQGRALDLIKDSRPFSNITRGLEHATGWGSLAGSFEIDVTDGHGKSIQPSTPAISEKAFVESVHDVLRKYGAAEATILGARPALSRTYGEDSGRAAALTRDNINKLIAGLEAELRDPAKLDVRQRQLVDRIVNDYVAIANERLDRIEQLADGSLDPRRGIGGLAARSVVSRFTRVSKYAPATKVRIEELHSVIKEFDSAELQQLAGERLGFGGVEMLKQLGMIPSDSQIRAALQVEVDDYAKRLNRALKNKVAKLDIPVGKGALEMSIASEYRALLNSSPDMTPVRARGILTRKYDTPDGQEKLKALNSLLAPKKTKEADYRGTHVDR